MPPLHPKPCCVVVVVSWFLLLLSFYRNTNAFPVAQPVVGFKNRMVRSTGSRHLLSATRTTTTTTTGTTTDDDPPTTNHLVDTSLDVCLHTLEHRLQHGPGTLTQSALDTLEASIAALQQEVLQERTSVVASAEQQHSNNNKYEPVPVVPSTVHTPSHNTPEQDAALRAAIRDLNATRISELLLLFHNNTSTATLDATLTDVAFWTTVQAVDRAEARDEPLSADVATMLHHVFAADHELLISSQREHLRANITCRSPDDSSGTAGAARRMNYVFDDGDHKHLPLVDGRTCEGGTCCDACSRNVYPTFATPAECDMTVFPELASFTFNELEKVSAATILQFVRLIERVRRTIAYEYGLPLSSILPLQAYSRKYVAGTTQRGGGGGEGDFVILHTDEATHAGYHYSCVLYLSTQGEDFEGGDFVFNDPAEGAAAVAYADDEEEEDGEEYDENTPVLSLQEEIRRAGRQLTPFHPTRGAAVIFSSGWENMHEVEKITSGTRYAIPCFFTTCPVPDAAYEQMVAGKPQTTEDIADDWLHLLLAHRKESPMESVGRVKELMMKWHTMCTPLSEH